MGTRSTTKIYDNGKFLLGIYKQLDGYPEYWGKELKKFIDNGVFINGINGSKKGNEKFMFNGISDFALMLVKEFKEGTGELYATTEDDEQEYNYIIEYEDTLNENGIHTEYKLTLRCKENNNFNYSWEGKLK
jgi:hypothetical protein